MWIEKKDKELYLESNQQGIRLITRKNVNEKIHKECVKFCRWLRKSYWFPIRCKIILFNTPYFKKENALDKDSVADFYYEENDDLKIYPEIWVAVWKNPKRDEKEQIERVCGWIVHELTHYYQWYFLQFEKRTNRSLEIEANKWSKYLTQEYFSITN